ncbi:hypothetical protein PV08_08472 [Exophiala spinifera]|uniref:RlpA-like protein double-psi beta-barrel domain-containing protein n=1 Tax=Exophiala spinifera TaxID=91928 RepID=A0A0D2BQ79_9EURO|nr:uncharacterized protein PV08_08472 [Exophiala spinifera]KIW13284.1 hypothetical protein PV08_08472 [Exophiala spinifera]
MAVLKNITLAALLLLTPFATAAPRLDARSVYTHTDTEIVWVTVEETTTVWLEPGEPTPAPAPVAAADTTTVVVADGSTTSAPAVFAQTAYEPSTLATVTGAAPAPAPPSSSSTTTPPAAAAVVSSAPASVAPSPAPAPAPSAAPAPAPAPAPAAESSPAAAVAPTTTTAAPSAPAPSPSASTGDSGTQDISASTSATCEGTGAACVGDVTHWDGGLGACGWNVDTNSDLEIALPYQFMGTQSNGNPYCGRSVTLYNPTSGTTVKATVGDKCMGCVARAIDCTDALFNAITDGTGNGRVSGIQWWFD